MSLYRISEIAITVVGVALFFIPIACKAWSVARENRTDRLTICFSNRDFSACEKLLDSVITKVLLSHFERRLMRLKIAIAKDSCQEVSEALDAFRTDRLDENQLHSVYFLAFSYYACDGHQIENAKKYYRLLTEIKGYDNFQAKRVYNTMVEKGYKYLESTKKELSRATAEERSPLESLLAIMYDNKGDHIKAEEYRELSKQHTQDILDGTAFCTT